MKKKEKEITKTPSEKVLNSKKKPSKWNFLSRLFKRSPKPPKTSTSKDTKKDANQISYNDSSRNQENFSSFLNNVVIDQPRKRSEDFFPQSGTSTYRAAKNNQPLSKIIENGVLNTPDKKFLKKVNGGLEIKELSFIKDKEGEIDFSRPKKPLDSTRNNIGALKYHNTLEKFERKIERKFSFSYREKTIKEIFFNVKFFKEIIGFLPMESLINFSFVSKKFRSNEYKYKSLVKKHMVFLVSKVFFFCLINKKKLFLGTKAKYCH